MNIEQQVFATLTQHTIAPLSHANVSADLLGEGYLDSLGIVALTFSLQDAFGVRFELEDLVPSNFQSVPDIARLVQQALSRAGSANEPAAG